jgi:hypothetical protein
MRNSLFEPTLRIDPSSRPARTRPLAAVFSKSFQSSSSLALVACSFFVAAGIKALICPARCPAAGGAQRAGSGESRRQSTPAIRRFSIFTGVPLPNRDLFFLGLGELCQSPEESQRSGTLGVTRAEHESVGPVGLAMSTGVAWNSHTVKWVLATGSRVTPRS